MQQCRDTGIETIYDITSLYENHIPQDESAFLNGALPNKSHYIIKEKLDINAIKT